LKQLIISPFREHSFCSADCTYGSVTVFLYYIVHSDNYFGRYYTKPWTISKFTM